MESIPRFYVYVLCRPNGSPFYVGKGQGNRIDAHESFARNGYKAKRYSIIRKIWREGGNVFKQKIYHTDDETIAYAIEQATIAAIGREYLANETDGGDGNHGWRPSAEHRSAMSARMKGIKHSPEWHRRVQAAKIGKPRSEECKAKIRATLTGRPLPPKQVAAMSAANKGKPWSEAERASIPASLRVPKPNLRGEKHHHAKWTADQVREVRRLYKEGVKPVEIIRRTGIPRGSVKSIIERRVWKWLDADDGNCST